MSEADPDEAGGGGGAGRAGEAGETGKTGKTGARAGARTRLLIVGAGGLGREMYYAAQRVAAGGASGEGFDVAGFLDKDPDALAGKQLCDVPVLGSWTRYHPEPDDRLLIAIGDTALRAHIAAALAQAGARFATLIVPDARINTDPRRVGQGCFIDHYALISCDVTLGAHSHLGSHATLGHDVSIGAGCHIGAFAFIGGGAQLGERVTVRSHATIAPGTLIEDDAVIGPNSLVVRRVRRGDTVMGVPAVRIVV